MRRTGNGPGHYFYFFWGRGGFNDLFIYLLIPILGEMIPKFEEYSFKWVESTKRVSTGLMDWVGSFGSGCTYQNA